MADLQILENAKVGVLAGSSTREFEFEVTPMSSMVGKGPQDKADCRYFATPLSNNCLIEVWRRVRQVDESI
jgi:hypothetical protein